MLAGSLRRSWVRRDRLSSSPLTARIRENGRPGLLRTAAEQMTCDAAGRNYSRPPPRHFWTTGAFLVAEYGLCRARAVKGNYREKPRPAPFGTWCHECGHGSPYQNPVRDGGALLGRR
jgi:hypothetical protein